MSVLVNPPPQLRIPVDIPESLRRYLEQDRQILFQLWNRTGGTTDIVDENTQNLTSTGSRVSRNAAVLASIDLKQFQVINVTADFTTDRNQILICRNTSEINVTLDPQAIAEDRVHIKRRNAAVNVIGTVDGKDGITLNIKKFSVHLVFDGTDWSQL